MELYAVPPTKPAFSDFYADNYQKTVLYISNKIRNYHQAEDLASEVFLYCYDHYDNYDPSKSALSTWLYLIVNSRIKNYYRDNKSYVDLETLLGVLPDDSADMDAAIYLQQLRKMLDATMAKLPERQRKIVYMRYFEEQSNVEIAQILGMSPGNVRVQLSRAIDTLERICGNLLD